MLSGKWIVDSFAVVGYKITAIYVSRYVLCAKYKISISLSAGASLKCLKLGGRTVRGG
jgi:hypothetical protein